MTRHYVRTRHDTTDGSGQVWDINGDGSISDGQDDAFDTGMDLSGLSSLSYLVSDGNGVYETLPQVTFAGHGRPFCLGGRSPHLVLLHGEPDKRGQAEEEGNAAIGVRLERAAGIEPASSAWKAEVIASIRRPLSKMVCRLCHFRRQAHNKVFLTLTYSLSATDWFPALSARRSRSDAGKMT